MLSSKELLEKSGVSRATLNNYIGLGLIPKPVVKNPEHPEDRARRLGYFPADTLDRLAEISQLKKQGLRIAEIAARLNASPEDKTGKESTRKKKVEKISPNITSPALSPASTQFAQPNNRGLRLTIDQLEHPAYLVNNKFEIEWANPQAEKVIFSRKSGLSSEISERNIFRLLFETDTVKRCESREEIFRLHLSIAKNRLTKAALLTMDPHLEGGQIEELAKLYDDVPALESRALRDTDVNLAERVDTPRYFRIYISFFREGIFFAYMPADGEENSLMSLLARRDLVIRDLLRNRKPYMTPLAVLVADLQDSVKICAELPPEEYFELINQVWGAMEPKFRKYYATHGKHVGDGIVYYFFPQPDCNYVFNAIQCAYEMKEAMQAISQEWRTKKNWMNELRLNIGLDEGQEWFGAYQTPTHLEFTVLGDTINRAARLSDFARNNTIWVTKNMLATLNSKERQKLTYGIRRQSDDGQEILVPSTYGRINNLRDLDDPANMKLRDIGALPVTEIIELHE